MGIDESLKDLPDWDELEQQERMERAYQERELEREAEMREEGIEYENEM